MKPSQSTFKLIMAGSTNIHSTINILIQATLKAREVTGQEGLTFDQVHIFHTEQSFRLFAASEEKWHIPLEKFNISMTSLIHHVTKIEDSSAERFRDLVEQLRTIVNPLNNTKYYIDVTGGISSLKSILAVFAYVLDIENVYSLEVDFSSDQETRKKQQRMFYSELIDQEDVKMNYKQFPPIREFDTFGKLNYTEVIRHRQLIGNIINNLSGLFPKSFDMKYIEASLLAGINSRLRGEVNGDSFEHSFSIFSNANAVDQLTGILLSQFDIKDPEANENESDQPIGDCDKIKQNNQKSIARRQGTIQDQTLGPKLRDTRKLLSSSSKYFIDPETLEYLTELITKVRNDVTHTNSTIDREQIAAIQSSLFSTLSLVFLQFVIKTLGAFADQNGNLLNSTILDPVLEDDDTIFYFGFDGDATGEYLEIAFGDLPEDELEVIERSRIIYDAIKDIKRMICKATKDSKSVLFAQGDNLLFKAPYRHSLIGDVQARYKELTGLDSSIGFGKTLKESTIALRLAKSQPGDSVIGISIQKHQETT